MRVTITVEGDEGVKASSTFDMEELCMADGIRKTVECALIEQRDDPDYTVRFGMVSEKFVHLAQTHASIAANKIVNFFREHNAILMQRNRNTGENMHVREVKVTEDVDEAIRWLSDGTNETP